VFYKPDGTGPQVKAGRRSILPANTVPVSGADMTAVTDTSAVTEPFVTPVAQPVENPWRTYLVSSTPGDPTLINADTPTNDG
jgi:hypothetical protein